MSDESSPIYTGNTSCADSSELQLSWWLRRSVKDALQSEIEGLKAKGGERVQQNAQCDIVSVQLMK
jgi:hypothetical protein